MKIGVILPHDDRAERPARWADVRSFAEYAERVGLDSVWVFDHLFHEAEGRRSGQLEAWSVLTAAAAVTERVEVGALVLCNPFRNPVLLASMAATLDEISGGRLILGIGAGWHPPEFAALGERFTHRVARLAEAVPLLRRLLDGERVSSDGPHYPVTAAEIVPAPQRRVPILVAARRPRMLELTARHADAWNIAWFGAPDDRLRGALADLDAALAAEGRDPATLTRTVGVVVHDPGSGIDPDPEDTVVSLGPEELARVLDEYAELGVDHLVVLPQPHVEATLDLLAAAIRRRAARPA